VLRSPWLTQGYVDNPEASERSGPAGTCTRAISLFIMADGSISHYRPIEGRHQERGEWVSSLQIED